MLCYEKLKKILSIKYQCINEHLSDNASILSHGFIFMVFIDSNPSVKVYTHENFRSGSCAMVQHGCL